MNDRYRLDLSNRQGRIARPYIFSPESPTLLAMSAGLHIDGIRDALRRIMKRKGVAPTTLSLQVGTSKTLVKDLLEKTGDVKVSTLVKLASALEVDVDELLARPRVPIAGHIGAGGVVVFEDYDGEVADSFVMRPPGVSGDLIALMVLGTSMLPKYRDGDIIYSQRNHDGVLPEDIGEDCAVRTADGGTYVKQLAYGSGPGKYTLLSLNADEMPDVAIQWATPVLFIMPNRARL